MSWIPFVASVHGWPFANFKSGHGLPFDIFANCGGMCHTALDRYYRRKPVDRSATAPDGSALRSEIERRQTDSIFPGIWLKTVSWASKGATGMQTDHLQHSTGHLTQSEEWPDIKNKLDSQEPTVICLVRGADPTDAHQVVATGYHAHDGNRVTMSVYDPNHPDEDDWIVQFFLGRPESQLLASQFRQSTRATEAELKGFFRVDYDRKVNLHVHQFDEAGLVGNRVDQRTWTAGWDNVNTYQIGQKTFLFLLKSLSGVVNIHEMNPDGSVGESIQTADWTSGWTTVTFYRVGDETYLFILKAHGMGSDGCNVHVNRINADGTIGDKVFAATWSDGWTDAVAFTTGGNAFLLILKRESGAMKILPLRPGGAVGSPAVAERDWSSGWTTVRTYTIGTTSYLLLMKRLGVASDGGNMHIYRFNSDGTIGAQVGSRSWTAGWTGAFVYFVAGHPRLFLLKNGGGRVDLHKFTTDGKVGQLIKQYDWSSGWDTVETYTIGADSYLLLLKSLQVDDQMDELSVSGAHV